MKKGVWRDLCSHKGQIHWPGIKQMTKVLVGKWSIFVLGTVLLGGACWFVAEKPATAQDLGLSLGNAPVVVGGGYVGSETCRECHKRQYENYMKNSRKARSFEAIEKMRKGLTKDEIEGCYACHTTGYGKATGFESEQASPHLKDVGCEACHGPGKLHTQSMEMAHIVKTVTIDVCEKCHVNDNVKSFRYKSVIYAGAH